jgi:type I restriction enzyme S subunit
VSSLETQLSVTSPAKDNGLPEGWLLSSVGECVDILDSRRVPVNSEERAKRQGDVPYYGATGQVGWIDGYVFNEELLLLGEDGAPFLDKSHTISYLVDGKSWVNNHAHVLRAVVGLTTNRFLKFWLDAFDFSDYVTGSTRLKLTQNAMTRIPVSLPPANEQRRIVQNIEHLLRRVTVARDHLSRVRMILKRFRQAVLAAACSGRLTEDARDSQDQTHRSDYNVDSDLTEIAGLQSIPDGWAVRSLDSLRDRSRPITYGVLKPGVHVPGGVPLLRILDIADGECGTRDWHRISPSLSKQYGRTILKGGEILVSLVGTIGRIARVPTSLAGANIHRNLGLVAPGVEVIPDYLYLAMLSPIVKKQIEKLTSGANQPLFNLADLKRVVIPLPPRAEQKLIVERTQELLTFEEKTRKHLGNVLRRSDKLTQSILAKAFRGELVPTEAELARREGREYEPASVLLERIEAERESIAHATPQRRRTRSKAKLAAAKGSS